MTDDTKNNIEKKTLIDRIDDSLIGFHKKLAVKWMNKTGKSQSQLEQELYYGSAAMLGAYAISTREALMIIPTAVVALRGALAKTFAESRAKTADKEEFWLNDTKFDRYLKVAIYTAGIGETVAGVAGIVTGAITKEPQVVKSGMNHLVFGAGLIGWCSAHYVGRAQIEPVKEKSKIDETMFRYK